MAEDSWLILLSSDQPRSQWQARLQASRYGRGWTAGLPNLPKTAKKTATISNDFQCNACNALQIFTFPTSFLSFCIIPTFRWVSSLGGSFYGRYLRSSPYEKVAIGSSHRLNVLHNCGALHYDTFKQTESVNPSTVSSGCFWKSNHTLHIILWIYFRGCLLTFQTASKNAILLKDMQDAEVHLVDPWDSNPVFQAGQSCDHPMECRILWLDQGL